MIRAFTGPTFLTEKQARWAALRMLAVQPVADVWRSGCAYGIDTLAAWLAVGVNADLEFYQPAAPYNQEVVRSLVGHEGVVVKRCVAADTNPSSYRNRNNAMLQGADQLVAFVKKPADEYYRSGEWMTINIARTHHIETQVYQLPGSKS